MGKYTKYRGKVPDAPRSEYWAKIDAHKADYLATGVCTFAAVGEYLKTVDKAQEEMEADLKELGYQRAALERIMLDLMDASKLDKIVLPSGSYARQDVLGVVMEDRGAFYTYLKVNGMEDLFSANANTAAMIVKEALLADLDLPPGTSVNMRATLQRKDKGEE